MREFSSSPAVRRRVPLLVGLTGPSSSGKTFTALRLARGMQRVFTGPIYGIDTESGRMLHYAHEDNCPADCKKHGHFAFQHVPFAAPFGAFDYLDAIRFCANAGASSIIIDSASHMHEGQGGMLHQHETELDRMCGNEPRSDESERDWQARRDANNFRAWAKPKEELGRFVQALLQMQISVLFCFRAKKKSKPTGKQMLDLGLSAIADDSLIFEMTAQALFYAGARGVPTWYPKLPNEQFQTKLPEWFLPLERYEKDKKPLDESAGELMARWAMGSAAASSTGATEQQMASEPPVSSDPGTIPNVAEIITAIETATATGMVARIAAQNRERKDLSDSDRETIRSAIAKRSKELQR